MHKRWMKILALFVCVSVLVVALVPWRALVEQKLTSLLQEKGFETVALTVEQVGLGSITLGSVSLGGATPLSLEHLSVHYSLVDLWRGRLHHAVFSGVTFRTNGIAVATGEVNFTTLPADQQDVWKIQWNVNHITFEGMPVVLPVTQANGTAQMQADNLTVQGAWNSADKTVSAEFGLHYPLNKPKEAKLAVDTLTMPWNKGTLGLRKATIPFSGEPFILTLMLKSISVDALLQPLTGERAKATGVVSGTLPLYVASGHTPVPKGGVLTSDAPGTLVMSPEAIPGDNTQVAMLRDVLKDFHYKLLSLSLDSDAKHALSVVLALEGNNPAMYEGRPVKLNVHLSGDVLDFITQNMATQNTAELLKKAH